MHVLFEEAGKLFAGRLMSEAQSSCQIELDSGKRVKVKSAHVLLRFDQPAPNVLLAQGEDLSASIDLDLAWEFAPDEEFGFIDLAREYFSATPSLTEQTAALLRLAQAPHYFRRAGKGRFKKAPAEIIQQALLAIEKKKQIQALIDGWAHALTQGDCPAPIREQLFKILFKPDKNAPEYKAVVEAARATQTAPLALLQHAGAIDSAYAFHWQRFLFEHFPKGTAFADLQASPIDDALPCASVQAYSIDDSHTTEIDDALSVEGLGSGTVTLGIHIAAPALALQPGDAIDQVGRQRLSTVYMPGYKITMLPDDVVQAYTLQAGRACPAVSLYVQFDEATLALLHTETRIERVPIAANLRHDQLDDRVTPEWLTQAAPDPLDGDPAMPHAQLAFLYRLACHLKAQRELVRGKPETFNRPDYSFRLHRPDGSPRDPDRAPQGDEIVDIQERRRGAPLDLMVAEAMILANSTWGQWLAQLGVPAIYRSQASLAPGVKVRMGTKALPHAGIGVPSYAWSTSPLRRYTDLVNQWQIIAGVRHGPTAALAAPFKPKDAELFAIISAFDAAYTAYNAHQASMERYWTLTALQQQAVHTLDATVFKHAPPQPPLARADAWPLVMSVPGGQDLARGTPIQVRITGMDLIGLDIHVQLVGVRQDVAPADANTDDTDDDLPSGPLAIAVDLNDPTADPLPMRALTAPDLGRSSLRPLHLTLAISVLVHAALLTLRIAAPEQFDRLFNDLPLEVILVNTRAQDTTTPTAAQALAQTTLAGGGDQAKGRAASPLPSMSATQRGESAENLQRRVEALQKQQSLLLAQVKQVIAQLPPPQPHQSKQEQAQREEKLRHMLKLLAEIEQRIQTQTARPRKHYISPATREVTYAIYYDSLRRKIEERGTRFFPEQNGQKLYGELIMVLTIGGDGRVLQTEIVQSSGNPLLDRRAQAIAAAAGPFGVFTPEMRREADQLAVISRFIFSRDNALRTQGGEGVR